MVVSPLDFGGTHSQLPPAKLSLISFNLEITVDYLSLEVQNNRALRPVVKEYLSLE